MIETLKCLNKLSPGIIITKIPYDQVTLTNSEEKSMLSHLKIN